jgi:transposase
LGSCQLAPPWPTQGESKLRPYRRLWKIERTFSWLGSYRRLLARHESYSFVFATFIKLACLLILLKPF